MFTQFKMTKNAKPLTADECNKLFELLDAYAQTEDGDWLNSVEYRAVDYYWSPAMTLDSGIMGAKPLLKNSIYLMPSNTADTVFWIELIASTVVHELRHVYQQNRLGKVLWSILKLPEYIPGLYGKVYIEKDAFAAGDKADLFFTCRNRR